MKSVNPATGEILVEFEVDSKSIAKEKIKATHETFSNWKKTKLSERAECFQKLALELRERKKELGRLITQEMGKPLSQAQGEVEKCAWLCEYYAENAEKFLARQEVVTDAQKSFISFQPLGVILAVMPWNFPFWQAFRCAVPSMMAGNTLVLKHASNVIGCALKMEELFEKAGFPKHAFTALKIPGKRVDEIIEMSEIRAVSLTGSTPAGKSVATKAGEYLKKTVLELGGSDPYVVLDDANIKEAAKACTWARMQNTGQSCIAGKRFIVVDSIYDKFLEAFIDELKELKVGDPLDEESDLGPMARSDLRDELHKQVQDSVNKGAKLLFGGELPKDQAGYFYPVTLLTEVCPGMPAFDEELFGPVAAVIRASGREEAFRLANKSEFGLGSAIFTQDLESAEIWAQEAIDAGATFVNSFVKSDPRMPFGGVKTSGFGRELSHFGIHEFVNIKSVYIS